MDFHLTDNQNGLTVTRAYGLDSIVEIPEADFGEAITEVSSYCFAETQRGVESPAEMYGDEAVAGTLLTEVSLPRTVKKIGAYAFYNCYNLRRLSLYSTTRDLGAGLFTGCSALRELCICVVDGERSCMRELLMELNQPLRVDYCAEDGTLLAKLVFPEFFENSIENTPGRILMRDVHGCGIMYRNCFQDTVFQFRDYDRLFREADIYNGAALCCELAVKRLLYPYQLTRESQHVYEQYLLAHAEEAAAQFDAAALRRMVQIADITEAQLDAMLELLLARGAQALVAIVMDAKFRLR